MRTSLTDDSSLTRVEVKRRATAGVFFVATRWLLIVVLGFVGNIIVARLLTPEDFGLVAFGMVVVLFTQLVSDGGLGAGLIRRAEPPTDAELGALSAFQLAVTGAVSLATVAVAGVFGQGGWVTAIMVGSMPFVALQFPGRILMERALLYRRLAVVELVQAVAFQAWAVGTVIMGAGVWGLATATLVRGLAGAVMVAWVCPEGLVRPRFATRLIKPLLSFGIRFQAVHVVWIGGEQTLNASVGAVGGISDLGLWVLARRLVEVPLMLTASIRRVSFPVMSKLIAAQENVGPLIERAMGVTAISGGFLLAALAGGAPGLVPGIFGEHWQAASSILPGACLAVGISGPVLVATQGFLFVVDDATAVLRGEIVQEVLWISLSLGLYPVLGIAAVGIGWAIASVPQAVILCRATTRRSHAALLRPLLVPLTVGACASAAGWEITVRAGSGLAAGFLGASASVLLFGAGLALFDRTRLRDTCRLGLTAVRNAWGGGRSGRTAE
ncbi:oligosaccharide flippase family protein [Streptomyces sp. NPDC006458]|uniref:oligosaccharide flippase family protein n=1 Tax=Streptomyces sp. NPDC006458 TaxID=3154302 RepID=UPI0033A88256